jgi:hypothetical protein
MKIEVKLSKLEKSLLKKLGRKKAKQVKTQAKELARESIIKAMQVALTVRGKLPQRKEQDND